MRRASRYFIPKEKKTILAAFRERKRFKIDETIVEWGLPDTSTRVITNGFGIRRRFLDNGERQAADLVYPGDLFSVGSVLFDASDEHVAAIGDCEVALLTKEAFFALAS